MKHHFFCKNIKSNHVMQGKFYSASTRRRTVLRSSSASSSRPARPSRKRGLPIKMIRCVFLTWMNDGFTERTSDGRQKNSSRQYRSGPSTASRSSSCHAVKVWQRKRKSTEENFFAMDQLRWAAAKFWPARGHHLVFSLAGMIGFSTIATSRARMLT